jgi:bifunctional UDP-N-acetylglucosamine pyrophosphorylase/glucosamine-1-phosphate N-acetyltransferase
MTVSLIILAAGMGSRMNSDLPKVLHPVGAAPLLHHALAAGLSLDPAKVIVVTGHGADLVAASAQEFYEAAETVLQEPQLGTGHAVAQAAPLIVAGDAIVLYGDTPFVRPETLAAMQDARARWDLVILGFHAADPGRYGRLITDGDDLLRIVEYKDATEAERAIDLCNSGVVCAKASVLFDLVSRVTNDNAAGEYYLTDIIELARHAGLTAGVVLCNEAETMGINTRTELACAEAASNLARYDGLRYGLRLDPEQPLHEAIAEVRRRGFGPEVQRRLACGA